MSVFEGNQTDSFLETIVKEKGEQWRDPEALAKGYVNSQEYITSLERQVEEMKEDITKASTVEQLLAEIQKNQPPATGETSESANSGSQTNDTSALSEEDIKGLVEKHLTESEVTRTHQQNLSVVDKTMTDKFGTEASKVIDQKSVDLGISKERLQELAGESPEAFLALMGEAPNTSSNQTAGNSVNTQGDNFSSNPSGRSWEWYQELRRKNKETYYSPKIQKQLHEDVANGVVQLPT